MYRLQTSQRGTKFSNALRNGPHCHSYIEASFAIFRISTGVVDPETVAITNSRSKEAFDRPCDETRSRSRALWQDANRMAIGNHALHPVLSFRAEARRPRRL